MAVLKITEYQIGQDKSSGIAGFKVRQVDGSISGWVGSPWFRVPFPQFSSLILILMSGNAFYDDAAGLFLTRGSGSPVPLSGGGALSLEGKFELSKKPVASSKIIKTFQVQTAKKATSVEKTKNKKS